MHLERRSYGRQLQQPLILQKVILVRSSLSNRDERLNASWWTGVAKRLQQKIPNSVILNQYSNMDNPLAHELTTGPEIIDAIVGDAHSINTRKSSGQVDAIVIGAGTGGTITGISRAIKKAHNPECVVVGVDPVCELSGCKPSSH